MLAVEALLAVAMHLIRLPEFATLRSSAPTCTSGAIHQNGHVIAVGMAAGLSKLLDHLHRSAVLLSSR